MNKENYLIIASIAILIFSMIWLIQSVRKLIRTEYFLQFLDEIKILKTRKEFEECARFYKRKISNLENEFSDVFVAYSKYFDSLEKLEEVRCKAKEQAKIRAKKFEEHYRDVYPTLDPQIWEDFHNDLKVLESYVGYETELSLTLAFAKVIQSNPEDKKSNLFLSRNN